MRTKLSGILTLLMAFFVQFTFAQEKTISGMVSDEQGLPLPGVNIIVKNTANGTQTDFDGNYTIKANEGAVLTFSYLGFLTKEVSVGSTNEVNVQLSENVASLEEIVVIGYGQQTKQKLVQSVSVISGEDLRDIPAVSPQELIQGQASGVQVVNSSGILGAAPVIKIRGVGSITSGGRPLIVIDGVPLNDSNQTGAQGGQALNPLGDLNPNDIESFSVLKDAAATAVYGSRGSNGVILISTKKGKTNQKTRVTLDLSTSISEATDLIDMMNADQFRNYLVEAGFAPNTGVLPQGQFDWVPAVVRTGVSKDINVSASGGGENTTFFIGATVKDQEGFIVGNNLERISARVNVTTQANDWLRLGINVGITETKNDRIGTENNTAGPLTTSYLQRPYVEPTDADGNFVNTGFLANVIAIEALNINDANTFRTVGNIFGEIKISDGLNFRTDLGVDRVYLENFQRNFEVNTAGGFAQSNIAQQNKYVFTNTLNYNTTFADVHDLSAVVGISYEDTEVRNTTASGTGFLSDQQINVVSASTPGTTSSTSVGNTLVGYFGRFNYSFDGKYVVEGSLRRDGSSKFGANFRYGTFWGVGAAWVMSQENFLKGSSVVSNLKIKGNYGITGNDRIGNFASLENFGGGAVSDYNGAAGLRQLGAANPDLKWERSKSYDIGLELGLFDNRVTLNVDYYDKTTDDLILQVPILQTNGGLNILTKNAGEMTNKGFDVDLGVDLVRGNDFDWSVSLNAGLNKNEVISLPGAAVGADGRRFIAGSASQRAIEGESVNNFFLIRYSGVNPQTGDAEWLDANGNITTDPVSADRVIAGDANPDVVGGFRSNIRYKDFDLNFFFNFSIGNDIMVDGLRFTDNPASSFNNSTRLLDVWRNPGDNAFVPAFSSSTFQTFSQRSTLQLKDGSYARLKNITLGYNMPEKFAKSLGFIKGIRIYATANNLLTIKSDDLEGVDPEVTDTIGNQVQGETFFTPPQAKTYLFGARFSF